MAFFSDHEFFLDQGLGVFVCFDGMRGARHSPQIASVIAENFLTRIGGVNDTSNDTRRFQNCRRTSLQSTGIIDIAENR